MNRAERRRVEQQRTVRRLHKELTGQILQEVENERVEALMTCFALALHEEFGFGKERCLRGTEARGQLHGALRQQQRERTAAERESAG